MADHLAGRTPLFEATYRMRHKSGRWLWIAARGAASFDPKGKPRRFVGTLTDISEEVEAREALAERESQLRAILSVAPAAIMTLDEQARIEQFNPCAERMFGWLTDEVRGCDAGLLLTDEIVSGAAVLSLLQPDPAYPARTIEILGRRRDGSAFPLRFAMAPFLDRRAGAMSGSPPISQPSARSKPNCGRRCPAWTGSFTTSSSFPTGWTVSGGKPIWRFSPPSSPTRPSRNSWPG